MPEMPHRGKDHRHALLVGGGSESISLPAFRDVPYDPKRSFRAVIRLTRQPLLIVARCRSRR